LSFYFLTHAFISDLVGCGFVYIGLDLIVAEAIPCFSSLPFIQAYPDLVEGLGCSDKEMGSEIIYYPISKMAYRMRPIDAD
jgi:hypothetical protein